MIIILAGMQKSGSAYIYNLVNDSLICAGYKDAREIKKIYGLSNALKWHNNNIGNLRGILLIKLLSISFRAKRFTVKTHSGSTRFLDILLKLRLVKTIYIYRDPRDVLISAIDHGRKIIESGENHTFAKMVEFNDALKNVKIWTNPFMSYQKNKNVLCLKYEDLMLTPVLIMNRICDYLNIKLSRTDITSILSKFDRNNPKADMTGLHFNKGQVGRYKSELTAEQHTAFINELEYEIRLMGYEI